MSMTPRQRLLTVIAGSEPDCVPVAPDFSNMIPARLTGKPFWDLYLYNDPPIWEAYIACARHFNIDSLMDGYFPLTFDDERPPDEGWERVIVFRSAERIITRQTRKLRGERAWWPTVDVYYVADPPTRSVPPEKVGLPATHERWETLEGVKPVDLGPEGLKRVKTLMGDQGLVGVWGGANTTVLGSVQAVYDYRDNPRQYLEAIEERKARAEARFHRIMALEARPDFVCVGGSGTLIFQSPRTFRQIALPVVAYAIDLYEGAGIPTHVHSCGPERALVQMMAEETTLRVIDPLEEPPMGDCDLGEVKRRWGAQLVLKGNLHTTRTMLMGTPDDVIAASRAAIDAAACGGRFILSTGDQCGRDTPDQNLHAMIETARTYGQY